MRVHRFHTALVVAFLPALAAGSTVFDEPTLAYTSATELIGFSDPDEALLPSIAGAGVTVSFSTPVRASTVGNNWATWGAPPDTESATPRVLWSALDDNFDPVTAVTFTLDARASIFGFEAEPGPLDPHTITASFFRDGTLVETVTRSVSGNAGARLFAVEADPGDYFTSVAVTSDADWAAGQFRFAAAQVPEPPATLLLLPSLAALIWMRKVFRGAK